MILNHIRYYYYIQDIVIVSPTATTTKRAASIAKALNVDLALLHGSHNEHTLIGNVSHKTAVLIDNVADSCETLVAAAEVLRQNGAKHCVAVVTHGLFGTEGVKRIQQSWIKRLGVVHTVPLSEEAKRCGKIVGIDVSDVFAEAVRRVHNGES